MKTFVVIYKNYSTQKFEADGNVLTHPNPGGGAPAGTLQLTQGTSVIATFFIDSLIGWYVANPPAAAAPTAK